MAEQAEARRLASFADAQQVGWRVKPWWWGGHGTYHVAAWGLEDAEGWMLGVGAVEWLIGRDPFYRPEPGTPFYFVTRHGEHVYRRPDPDLWWRIHNMRRVGAWPYWDAELA